jgi:hypothetical protein
VVTCHGPEYGLFDSSSLRRIALLLLVAPVRPSIQGKVLLENHGRIAGSLSSFPTVFRVVLEKVKTVQLPERGEFTDQSSAPLPGTATGWFTLVASSKLRPAG